MVGRGDVNFAPADQVALLGEMDRQERLAIEDARQLARIGPDVQNDENRGGDLIR